LGLPLPARRRRTVHRAPSSSVPLPRCTVHQRGWGDAGRRARWPMVSGAPHRGSPGGHIHAVHGAPMVLGRHSSPSSVVAHSAPHRRFPGGSPTRCTVHRRGWGDQERRACWPVVSGAPHRGSPGGHWWPYPRGGRCTDGTGTAFLPSSAIATVHHADGPLAAPHTEHHAPTELGPYRLPRFAEWRTVHRAAWPSVSPGGARCTDGAGEIRNAVFVGRWRTVHHAESLWLAPTCGARCTDGTGTAFLPSSAIAHRAPRRWSPGGPAHGASCTDGTGALPPSQVR
jgi:hypothetical protein